MSALSRIVADKLLTEITSGDVALRRARARQNDNAHDLIREIESDIARQVGHVLIGFNRNDYTPEVVANVIDIYRNAGWVVDAGHCVWVHLYPKGQE